MSEKGPQPPQGELQPTKEMDQLAALPEEFQVLIWERICASAEDGIWPEKATKRGVFPTAESFLNFSASLNPKHLKFFAHLAESTWSPETCLQKMEDFKQNCSLKFTSEEAKQAMAFLGRDQKEAKAALGIGMELMLLRGVAKADELTHDVANNDTIDIDSPSGQKKFVEEWQKYCPELPMPAVPGSNDYWYLQRLKNKRIKRSNDETRGLNQSEEKDPSALPQFNQDTGDGFLWVDSWKEEDYGSKNAKKSHQSNLVGEFFKRKDKSTVNISRETIDKALWEGDPAKRVQSQPHLDFLLEHDFNPEEWELRLIRQDEYARGAKAQQWGEKNLWTHFEHYLLGDDGARYGLSGGYRGYGGPSYVHYDWRDDAAGSLAVRLVLSRKQK